MFMNNKDLNWGDLRVHKLDKNYIDRAWANRLRNYDNLREEFNSRIFEDDEILLCDFNDIEKSIQQSHLKVDERDNFSTYVRGTVYYENGIRRAKIIGETWFELRADLKNPHDVHALPVYAKNIKVGHVSSKLARNFQVLVRFLNLKGYRCFVPGFVQYFDSIVIILPTSRTWAEKLKFQEVEAFVVDCWKSIPESVFEDEIKIIDQHPTELSSEYLLKYKNDAPYLFPESGKCEDFPWIWHRFFQEARKDYRMSKIILNTIEDMEFNKKIISAYKKLGVQAEVARKLKISPQRVKRALEDSGIDSLEAKIIKYRVLNPGASICDEVRFLEKNNIELDEILIRLNISPDDIDRCI